jgi:hypothetical protein
VTSLRCRDDKIEGGIVVNGLCEKLVSYLRCRDDKIEGGIVVSGVR